MTTKISAIVYSFLITYLFSEMPELDLFPKQHFDLGSLAYGFVGSFVYSFVAIYIQIKDIANAKPDAKQLRKIDILLFAMRLFGAAMTTYILSGLFMAGLYISEIEWAVIARTKEAMIIFGILMGIGFEHLATKKTITFLSKIIGGYAKTFTGKLGTYLKNIAND